MTAPAARDVEVPPARPARAVVLVHSAVLLVLAAVLSTALLSGQPSRVGDGPVPTGLGAVDQPRLGDAGSGRVGELLRPQGGGSPASPLDGDRMKPAAEPKMPAPGGPRTAVGKVRSVPR